MYIRLIFFLAVVVIAAAGDQAPAQDVEALKAGVVKIRSQVEGQPRRTGTGFIVAVTSDRVVILTASHVVQGDPAPEVEFFTNRGTRVEAELGNQEPDDPKGLAILRLPKKTLPAGSTVLAFSAARVQDGAEVKVIGFPRGGADWSIVNATVAGRSGRDITLDGTVKEGNSGGPVLRAGEVVGVVTDTTDFARATPASTVVELLGNWGVSATARAAGGEAGGSPAPSASPDRCIQGYVWREAFAGDHVCVKPEVRGQAALDNSQAAARRQPGGGAYGPDTCRQGYVWREASPADHVCVEPSVREQTRGDNRLASTRVVQH